MARQYRRALSLAALALVAGAAGPAGAQNLPRLHILTLGQHPDTLVVVPHVPFHVTIRLTVKEHRTRFDDLILGDCTNCAIVGDERVPRSTPAGSEYIERLTLEAEAPGEARLSPAYIDAIDPASGKALRYSSNAVSVRVSGPAPIDTAERALGSILRFILGMLGFAAAALVLVALFVRRGKRRDVRAPAAAPVAAVPSAVPLGEQIGRAAGRFAQTRAEPERDALRALLFTAAGAAPGATLVDALRGLSDRDRPLRMALLAAERAKFGPAHERAAAADAFLAAVEAYSRATAPNEPAWTP